MAIDLDGVTISDDTGITAEVVLLKPTSISTAALPHSRLCEIWAVQRALEQSISYQIKVRKYNLVWLAGEHASQDESHE